MILQTFHSLKFQIKSLAEAGIDALFTTKSNVLLALKRVHRWGFFGCFSQQDRGADALTGRRNRDPLTLRRTKPQWRAALSPARCNKTFTYLYDNNRVRRTKNNGQWWQGGRADREGICSTKQRQGKDKGRGRCTARLTAVRLRNEAVDDKVPTTGCCQAGVDTDAEKETQSEGWKEWRRLRRRGRARCKWSMIADLQRFPANGGVLFSPFIARWSKRGLLCGVRKQPYWYGFTCFAWKARCCRYASKYGEAAK